MERFAAGDAPVYGINTGFGALAETRIPRGDLRTLQLNLLRSHAAGVGDPLPAAAVRATMALRANVLAKGYSGIRRAAVDALLALLNRRVHPVVPCLGSVGASGDLAPLAHVALVLIGEGAATVGDDPLPMDGAAALARAGLAPLALEAKEGLALINGTQPSAAVAALALVGAERVEGQRQGDVRRAREALRGSVHPFEERIHEPRGSAAQSLSAANVRRLLAGSAINRSHEACGRVQDAYSLRCGSQVHGAAREALGFVRARLTAEANAATDNPMVFAAEGEIVSGGNFHGAPVALAADLTCIAVAQLATISERRCDRLLNPALSELPAFLTPNGGLESGYMMAQVTAAALASELKTLAHPAGVDTIPTSANREDHVSMSMGAALKAARAVRLAAHVLAAELLCASQAIDLLAPLATSPLLARVHRAIRAVVPPLDRDRPPSPDIARIAGMIADGTLESSCAGEVK